MKKTLFAFSAIAVLLGFMACTSDEIVEPQVSGKTILKAYTETSATRTALADDGEGGYDVVWSTGDKFMVIGSESYEFTLKEINETDKTSATFECAESIDDDEYMAYYATEDEDNDYLSWPATQTYEAGKITNSPMAAILAIEDGKANAQFKNMGGLLRLTVKGTATIKSITISANEAMAGEFSFDANADPITAATITGSKKSITLDCGDGVALTSEGTQFYIAMPANTYTGVSITLTDDAGKVCVKKLSSTKNLVITRSAITPASFTASSFKPTITASSPVGTIGMLDGREGIVVDFGGSIGKVVVATMNVGATSVDYATAANNATCYGVQYDEYDASDPSKMGLTGGWSAPTPSELEALYNLTGGAWSAADYDNHKAAGYAWTIGSGENQNTLFFPAAGYNKGNQMGINCSYRSQIGSVYEYEEEMEIYNLLDIYETTKSLYDEFPGCKNCYSVRPFHAMPAASKTYNMGDIVEFSGHEGIVVDLGETLGMVAVATMNVGATVENGSGCLGDRLAYAETYTGWSGWRLPTVDEIKTLCDVKYPTWGDTMEGEGIGALLWYIDDKDGIDLYLPLNDLDDQNPYDIYWTGTPGENDTEKCFYFAPELDYESGSCYDYSPVDYDYRDGIPYKEEADKDNEYLVRLFHDLP